MVNAVVVAASSWADSLINSLGGSLVPWGYVIVFLGAAAESAAFAGLIVPGETLMLLAGFLCWRGDLDLGVTMACAITGAIIGDSIGYEIGRHLGPRIRSSWAGQKLGEERWARAHAYLRKKGGRAIFLGRFIGVLRALVPAVAGDSRMPYGTFLAWNVLGAAIASPAVILAGYSAGSSYKRVETRLNHASWIVGGCVVVFLVARYIFNRRKEAREGADSLS
jgi:membrane protein DedA with SNARE-associated domain